MLNIFCLVLSDSLIAPPFLFFLRVFLQNFNISLYKPAPFFFPLEPAIDVFFKNLYLNLEGFLPLFSLLLFLIGCCTPDAAPNNTLAALFTSFFLDLD